MILKFQICKDCQTIFENEEELAECPNCNSKRIEIVN